MKLFLHWAPRICSLLLIGFLSLFAFDVFNEYEGTEAIIPFLIHLLPALVLLVGVLLWRQSLVGAGIFLLFAVWYVWEAGFDKHWSWYAVIALPALVISLLYFADWLLKRRETEKNSVV